MSRAVIPEPFPVVIPDTTWGDLQQRLARTRRFEQPADMAWELGTDAAYLR